MPLQATSGAASYDAFGGGVAAVPNYIEDVFSTWLYTGTSATQSINNGLDESGKGALTWIKDRGAASTPQMWFDTTRGVGKYIQSNSTGAQGNIADTLTAFNSNGFTVGADSFGVCNAPGHTYASWTFRDQPKFKAQLTYTGNGGTLSVSHALGSKPGCIIIKRTDSSGNWLVITRKSDGNIYAMYLNQTTASFYDGTEGSLWTSTSVSINWINSNVAGGFNDSGASYVMYVLAHNAGGFGLTGTDNVISCGSLVGDAVKEITLGYEPQWILLKRTDSTSNWFLFDTMRGMPVDSAGQYLTPNTSNSEASANLVNPTATGFISRLTGSPAPTYIYIAIRRGPMKVPTDATKVFTPAIVTESTTGPNYTNTITSNFPVDWVFTTTSDTSRRWGTRLIGNAVMSTNSTSAETNFGLQSTVFDSNISAGIIGTLGSTASAYMYAFKRAPSFFDEVCYTGTGSARTVTHNLGVAPELMLVKARNSAGYSWCVYAAPLGASYVAFLNLTSEFFSGAAQWNSTTPTSSVFSLSNNVAVNNSGTTYVAYLFATCAGVQYINSYVGDGTTGRTINCGFAGGARFVCIKATSTSGSWWTFDSARGIVTNSDPALQLNSTAAEVTSADAIDTAASGFIVNQEATCSLNASGVSYLVWAIA